MAEALSFLCEGLSSCVLSLLNFEVLSLSALSFEGASFSVLSFKGAIISVCLALWCLVFLLSTLSIFGSLQYM